VGVASWGLPWIESYLQSESCMLFICLITFVIFVHYVIFMNCLSLDIVHIAANVDILACMLFCCSHIRGSKMSNTCI